ncbi:MAG: response regulator [Chitinophagaceae bacterium]|nr:response regulator [Chitinophagaceae bacterium]
MPRNILYVEDNQDAIAFFSRVVNKLGDYNFVTREDGTSAISLLEEKKDFTPEMILLDINLPGMNGFEILQYVRSKTAYKHVPVIMFTSSDDNGDVRKSYEYGANAYLIKPDSLQSLKEVLQDTFNFWLKHNVA